MNRSFNHRARSFLSSHSRSLRCEPLENRQMLSAVGVDLEPQVLSWTSNATSCQEVGPAEAFTEETSFFDSLVVEKEAAGDQVISPLLGDVRSEVELRSEVVPRAADGAADELSDRSSDLVRIDSAGQVQVYVHVEDVDVDTIQALESAGLIAEVSSADMGIVQGWVSCSSLDNLAEVDGVRSITPPDYTIANSSAGTKAGGSTSYGDEILGAADVREQFAAYGVDGSGIKVGVISFGIAGLTAAQASGDLPGTINIDPSVDPGTSSSHGTEMLEIVHDLAPGASLYLSGPSTTIEMASSINWLVDQGCDVIVDACRAPGEPYFEDGIVAQTAENAVDSGVVYVTAAGNDAEFHYQGQFVDSGSGFHDFLARAGVDNGNDIYVSAAATITVFLQWSDPFGQSGNDYDLLLFNSDDDLIAGSMRVQDGNDDPIEALRWTNTTGSPQVVSIAINKWSGISRELELYVAADGAVLPSQYTTPGDSVFGAAAVESVIAVGAIDSTDTGWDEPTYYSSRGPSTIYTDFSSQTSVERSSLDGMGIDNVNTSVGTFYGTSAAAPHAAALAALLLDANPSLTPAEVSDTLCRTAIDIQDAGYDDDTGWGRFNVLDAAYNVFTPSMPDLAPGSDTGKSGSDNLTNDTTPTFSGIVPKDSYVRLYVDGVQMGQQQLSGGASQYSITTDTLAPGDHDITVRVAPSSSTPTANLSNVSSALPITIDTLNPTVDLSAPASTNDSTPGVTVTASDANGLSDGTPVWLDVDLNNDGDFNDSGETGYVTSALTGGAATFEVTPGLAAGTYPFRARVADVAGNENADSATVTVTEVNVAPVLDPIGDRTVDELTTLTFTATATDSNLPAQALTFRLSGDVPAGASIDSATGQFTWTPTEEQGSGDYTFTVEVTDGSLTDSETITVTVDEVNAAPVLAPIGELTVNEHDTVAFTATATDADLPSHDLTYSLRSGAPAGAAIDPTTGRFTWTPDEGDGPGDCVFQVVVADELGDSDFQDVTIHVLEANEAPVLNPIGNKTVDGLTELTFTATATDADLPAQALTFSLTDAPTGADIDPDTGVFTWTPTKEQGPGSYTFTVTVFDGMLSDSEEITCKCIAVGPTLPGDLNGDGMVNSGDLDIVRSCWGQIVTVGDVTAGDSSGDGVVNSADLDIVRANWSQTTAAGAPTDSGTSNRTRLNPGTPSAGPLTSSPAEKDSQIAATDAVFAGLRSAADAAWKSALDALDDGSEFAVRPRHRAAVDLALMNW